MKQYKILFFITLVGVFCHSSFAMDQGIPAAVQLQAPAAPGDVPTSLAIASTFGPRRFKGKVISVSSIVSLAPQAPDNVVKGAQEFLATTGKPLVDSALGYEPMIGSVKSAHDAANKMLTELGKPNKSDWNYVFEAIPGYMMAIAGHVNRRENLTVLATDYFAKKHPYAPLADGTQGRWLTAQDYTAFQEGLAVQELDANDAGVIAPKTYQTISRMAHWLVFKQAQHDGKIPKNIVVPAMHLVHIPDRAQEVSDRNYVVISEKLNDLQEVTSLTEQEAQAVKSAIQETGLFGCNKGSLKRRKDGSLLILDLEQPNNSAPKLFFHNAGWKYGQNVNAGLEDFEKHFKQEVVVGKIAKEVAETLPAFTGNVNNSANIADLIAQYSAE